MTNTQPGVEERMAARYGTDRSRAPLYAAIAVVIVAYLAIAAWVGLALGTDRAEGNLLAWRAEPVEVAIELEVRTNTHGPVTCAIKATDDDRTDVGYRIVTIERAPVTTSIRIPTVIRATSVTVLGCAPADQPLNVPPPDFPPGVAIP